MTEADFRARQRIEANNPDSAVYTDAMLNGFRDDALAAISRAAPFSKVKSDFGVVAGTKDYALPADWITSTSSQLDAQDYPEYRLEDANGAYLYLDQHFAIYGRTLSLETAPTANATWKLRYGGTWLITDLPNDWVEIALDYATARFYDRKATEAAEYFSYDNGVEKVDRDAEAKKWRELRDARLSQAAAALALISTRISTVGTFSWERA